MKKYSESFDPNTNKNNCAFRTTFAGMYDGSIADLKIEEGKGQGFKEFSIEDLSNMSKEERQKFIPRFFDEDYFAVYRSILEVLFK